MNKRYFIKPRPGNTIHAYDREDESDGMGEKWRRSVCGNSNSKDDRKAKVLRRGKLSCKRCKQILNSREEN